MAPRFLLVGLACLAAAGCGGGDAAKEPQKPKLGAEAQKALDELDSNARPRDDADDIARLLDERAVALEAEDILALSATATGAQRARDRRSARRAKRLEIERIRFLVDDLTRSGNRAEAAVTMSYRVRGMSRPFLTERKLSVRRRSVGWRVSRDAPRREPLPWEVAAFRADRTSRVVLLLPPGVDAGEQRPGLADAYREIRRDLPSRDLPDRVLVIAARDGAQAARLTGRLAKGVVALANVSVRYKASSSLEVARVLAQRMIVVRSRWSELSAPARQAALVHEMTHTAMDADTSGRTPAWLVEGMAMYVSNDDRTAEASARSAGAGPTTRLAPISKPNAIFALGGEAQGAAYAAASAAAHAIVADKGNKALFALYDAFNDSAIQGRPGAKLTDRVMRRTIGLSLAELERRIAG